MSLGLLFLCGFFFVVVTYFSQHMVRFTCWVTPHDYNAVQWFDIQIIRCNTDPVCVCVCVCVYVCRFGSYTYTVIPRLTSDPAKEFFG